MCSARALCALFARSLHSNSHTSRIDSSDANSNSDGGSMDTVATPLAAVQAQDVCVFSLLAR